MGQRWPGMAAAHRDRRVGEVARALAVSTDFDKLLLYATSSMSYALPPATFLSRKKQGLSTADEAIANLVDIAAADWRLLDEVAFGERKGAVIEQLAATLIRQRMPADRVFPERKVRFSDDIPETSPFDVLAAPVGTTWEGVECKAGWVISDREGKELSWAAETAERLEAPLTVLIASAASRSALLPAITRQLRSPRLVCYVAAETFRTLAQPAPRYPAVA